MPEFKSNPKVKYQKVLISELDIDLTFGFWHLTLEVAKV
jgi:hypothetical protein